MVRGIGSLARRCDWSSKLCHMAGAAGFFALYLCLHQRYGVGRPEYLLLLLVVLGAVAWSRISLKRHTLQELLSGGLLGFFTVYALLSQQS